MTDNKIAVVEKKTGFVKKLAALTCVSAVAFTGIGFGIGVGDSFLRYAVNKMNTELSSSNSNIDDYGLFLAESTEEASNYSGNIQFMSAATSSGNGVVNVVKAVADSVVSINTSSLARSVFNRVQNVSGAGSGIIISEDSKNIYIATNNHVVEGATGATISVDDENEVVAHYVGSDYQSDLAVISVSKEELKNAGITNYKIANFGDSGKLEIGEAVVAIGNAAGEGKSATLGIVSAKNKSIAIDGRKLEVIQTDAAINPGNSGGALANMNGEIIGINTAKLSETGVEGMGYSIPSNAARIIFEEIITNGAIQRPFLGVQMQTITPELMDKYQFPSVGAYVVGVESNSSAANAGLRETDIIIGIGDKEITSSEDLVDILSTLKVGDTLPLYIYRSRTRPMTLEITIQDQNSRASF